MNGAHTDADEFHGFPGADLVKEGLLDLANGRESQAALLIQVAAPRLQALGIAVALTRLSDRSPEHRLYRYLADAPDPYRTYNALLARIASFARAAEHATPR
jgi:hypothetical protein